MGTISNFFHKFKKLLIFEGTIKTFGLQNSLSNGYGQMVAKVMNVQTNDAQMNAIEQAHAEEKRSLTALNCLISRHILIF